MVRRARAAPPLAVAVVALCIGTPAATQSWSVDAAAGHASYEGVRSEADGPNALLSLSYQNRTGRWGYLTGGSPLDGFGLPWAALGLGARVAGGTSLRAGADLAAHGYAYSHRADELTGAGGILHLLPMVSLARHGVGAELYSGLLHHQMAGEGRDSARSAHDSGIRLNLYPAARFSVGAEARLLRIEGEPFRFAGARADYDAGPVDGWVSVGRWLNASDASTGAGAGARLQLRARTSLNVSFRQETSDPLYGNLPRQSWSVGVSHRLGSAPAGGPAGVRMSRDRVTLRVPRSDSPDGLSVAGEFSGWEPVGMTSVGRFWSVDLTLQPGVYRYAFRRPDGSWFVPAAWHRRIDDGMGGDAAILIVP